MEAFPIFLSKVDMTVRVFVWSFNKSSSRNVQYIAVFAISFQLTPYTMAVKERRNVLSLRIQFDDRHLSFLCSICVRGIHQHSSTKELSSFLQHCILILHRRSLHA
jgi:hypothetical protein